jgi:uncharacterized protein YhfF
MEMGIIRPSAEACWQAFLASLPVDSPYRQRTYIVEPWGDTPALADELGGLIAAGTKTAACSPLVEFESQGQPIPAPGLLTIVIDGRGEPLCIIETSEVSRRRFDEVDAAFARAEGEGDRSLAYWREAHRRYFTRTLARVGLEFREDMILVCERFRVVYRPGEEKAWTRP